MAIQKGNKHQLGLFFLLEACQRNAAGWSTAVWPANAKLPLPHRRSSITRPCCSIERSSAKLLVFTCNSKFERSTGSEFFFFFLRSKFQSSVYITELYCTWLSSRLCKQGWTSVIKRKLILKTIGNRKGDCAWSCSRWQTQPEKICKSQRTNQCPSLRTLYWFVLCNLQIFSGCVCHLEQLHAQSPFLFPIVFSINLIPFFDICSVDLLAVFQPGCSGICYFATLLGPLRGRNSCWLWFWQLVFGVWLRDATSNLPSSPNPL